MATRVLGKLRQISLCIKEHGYIVGSKIGLSNLCEIIEETVGVDKRTKETYAKALCSRGFLQDAGNWTFTVLKVAEDEVV